MNTGNVDSMWIARFLCDKFIVFCSLQVHSSWTLRSESAGILYQHICQAVKKKWQNGKG